MEGGGGEESDEGSKCALQEWMRMRPFCFVFNIFLSQAWPDRFA